MFEELIVHFPILALFARAVGGLGPQLLNDGAQCPQLIEKLLSLSCCGKNEQACD